MCMHTLAILYGSLKGLVKPVKLEHFFMSRLNILMTLQSAMHPQH